MKRSCSKEFEFSTDHMTGQAQYREIGNGFVNELSESDTDVIQGVLDYSKTYHPSQYNAVSEVYKSSSINKRYYDFVRARRIINCCYGESDSKPDVDAGGIRHFEIVKCPLIAECKWYKIICQPEFETNLSGREYEVMKLYFEGLNTEEIADKLFLSIHTVKNHRCNSLARLNLNSMVEFTAYAHKNKLFNK